MWETNCSSLNTQGPNDWYFIFYSFAGLIMWTQALAESVHLPCRGQGWYKTSPPDPRPLRSRHGHFIHNKLPLNINSELLPTSHILSSLRRKLSEEARVWTKRTCCKSCAQAFTLVTPPKGFHTVIQLLLLHIKLANQSRFLLKAQKIQSRTGSV